MYTLEKISTSPLCILYTLPQMIPLLTLTLVCTLCEESTPWAYDVGHGGDVLLPHPYTPQQIDLIKNPKNSKLPNNLHHKSPPTTFTPPH